MSNRSIRVGAVQMQILRVLWDKGRATAREITDVMKERAPIAHSTVQTLLRQLEAKGAVGHDVEGRTFFFRPLVSAEEVQRSAAHEVVSRAFDGSAFGLVAHLVKNEPISHDELARIRKLIDDAEGAG